MDIYNIDIYIYIPTGWSRLATSPLYFGQGSTGFRDNWLGMQLKSLSQFWHFKRVWEKARERGTMRRRERDRESRLARERHLAVYVMSPKQNVPHKIKFGFCCLCFCFDFWFFFITFKRFQRPIRGLMRQLATHTDKITFVNLARTEWYERCRARLIRTIYARSIVCLESGSCFTTDLNQIRVDPKERYYKGCISPTEQLRVLPELSDVPSVVGAITRRVARI